MPNPKAQAINLSNRQRKQLEHIANRTTNAYRLVTRAKVILGAASGINNTELSQQLQLPAFYTAADELIQIHP